MSYASRAAAPPLPVEGGSEFDDNSTGSDSKRSRKMKVQITRKGDRGRGNGRGNGRGRGRTQMTLADAATVYVIDKVSDST